MNYDESIKFITSKDNFYIDLGLDRILSALDKLGNPQDKIKCIHVAGTNGKGSVCAISESILRSAGYKTGLYTSPHIWEYTERIKVCGKEIPKEKFAGFVEKIKETNIHLTEFEILTVMMFMYFYEEKVDIAVIETGLGGRLDATNVIKQNLCSIITRIDFDHTDRLGNTLEQIASEKAGIIKKNCPVYTSMNFESIKEKAQKESSPLVLVPEKVPDEYSKALSLKGSHQIENLSLVLKVVTDLFKDISKIEILEGLKNVKHHCRFEYIKDKNLVIDACHNPNGITALRENLDTYFPNIKRRFIFGCLKRKDYKKMMEILFREGDEVYIKEFDYPDACTYKDLESACPVSCKKYEEQELADIFTNPSKLNIICGSFYMIGQMKELKNFISDIKVI